MEILSLSQLEKLTGLPRKWLVKKLRKGIPTSAHLDNGRWVIPDPNPEHLSMFLKNIYQREQELRTPMEC